MELQFKLALNQKYMTIERLIQLEESIGWLSNATLEDATEAYRGNMVFVDKNGNISEYSQLIVTTLLKIGQANNQKDKTISFLKESLINIS